MRAAEALVVVGDTEGILDVNDAVDLCEANVLIETAWERTSCRLNLSGQAGIVGKEIRRETIYGGAVWYGALLAAVQSISTVARDTTIVQQRGPRPNGHCLRRFAWSF